MTENKVTLLFENWLAAEYQQQLSNLYAVTTYPSCEGLDMTVCGADVRPV